VRVQRLRVALGTWVTIEATAPTEPSAVAGIEAAYRAIAEVEWRMHPSREGSDLARINSAPPQTHVPIADSTWRVLRLAHAVHTLSEGTFDPCLPLHTGRLTDVVLSAPAMKSRSALCRLPLALDLGGIAKGYAIDRAIEALRATHCTSGLVNAGGDLRVYGRSEHVLLRRADGTCKPVTLTNAALAVSDPDLSARQRPAEHQGYYRRSGALRPTPRYAAVGAAKAAVADALTKCVLLADAASAACTLRAFRARRVA
jgi:FAD:protein FMN transferase